MFHRSVTHNSRFCIQYNLAFLNSTTVQWTVKAKWNDEDKVKDLPSPLSCYCSAF